MKKIIVAFDGLKFSESAKSYAIQVCKQSDAHLVGVFLEDFTYTGYKIYDLVTAKGGVIGPAKRKLEKKDAKVRAAAISNFESACAIAGLKFSVHRNRNVAIKELLHESIYADLLIIDSRETLTHHPEKPPTQFIRDLLTHVQCPVLLVPHIYKPVKKVIPLYDGEPSSVHAIKMFSYTMDSLGQNPVEVVSVNSNAPSLHIPDSKLMKEFMARHFPNCGFTVLKGLPEIEILAHLKKQEENCLVILGAYRRSMVSRWFRASMADTLMQNLKLPLFIAHNK
jgi:nucleotide-binding universal stress UspA family protein